MLILNRTKATKGLVCCLYLCLYIFGTYSAVARTVEPQQSADTLFNNTNHGAFDRRATVKTDLVWLATLTPNVAVEFPLGGHSSLNVAVGYNPFTFGDNRKWKHVAVRPEFRYWFSQPYGGHFFGLSGGYVHYNIGGVDWPFTDEQTQRWRYDGHAVGVGLSYGYAFSLSERWGLELSLGGGYVWTRYKRYYCRQCGSEYDDKEKRFLTPTNANILLVYRIGSGK